VGQNYGTDKYPILFAAIFVPERVAFGTQVVKKGPASSHFAGYPRAVFRAKMQAPLDDFLVVQTAIHRPVGIARDDDAALMH
jgi:hypothetical protein